MKSGLLWFDNSKKPMAEKIDAAMVRYQEKFGVFPNMCFIHPSDFANDLKPTKKITILVKQTIMPNHIWLGLQDRETVQVRRTETYILVGSDDVSARD